MDAIRSSPGQTTWELLWANHGVIGETTARKPFVWMVERGWGPQFELPSFEYPYFASARRVLVDRTGIGEMRLQVWQEGSHISPSPGDPTLNCSAGVITLQVVTGRAEPEYSFYSSAPLCEQAD